jgi:tetratricopeptide (TPR) repeat protein
MPIWSRNMTVPTCTNLLRGAACRPGSGLRAVVAVLLICSWCCAFDTTSAPAQNAPSPGPWALYIEAAADAQGDGDLAAAEALLTAANDFAEKSEGRESLRASITRLLLTATYADLNLMDAARAVPNVRINLGDLDASFLPVTRMLSRLGDTYYARWQRFPAAPPTEDERTRKAVMLELAARFARVEGAFQQKLLPPDDQRIATTLLFLGRILRIQGKLDEAIEQLEKANAIWDNISSKRDLFARASEEAALFPRALSRQTAQGLIETKLQLAFFYLLDGLRHQDEKDDKRATERFTESERLILDTFKEFGAFWPDHPTSGMLNFRLADLYSVWKDKAQEAEPAYQRSLAIYEAANGPASDNAQFVARELADFLRKAGKEDAAKEIEQRYGLKTPAP